VMDLIVVSDEAYTGIAALMLMYPK
jgi:hypothetical protein